MARKYNLVSVVTAAPALPGDGVQTLINTVTDKSLPDESSGSVTLNSPGAPQQIGDPNLKAQIVMLRVVTGGPFEVHITSGAGADQIFPLSDSWSLVLNGADEVTVVALKGVGTVEYLLAGSVT